ncbi:MAG: hypothetical protein Q8K26_03250 [Candidatus Gracilibacteria bacterium]|nr:hypothetical protein [Candidatus Gracilibacteria bacterium]
MPDTLTDIHIGPLSETVFLSDMRKIEDNPTNGVLSDYYDINQLGRAGAERYISSKDLAKLQADLRRAELKEKVNDDILDKNLAEKLFITDFIQKGYIFPEKSSQDLYFRFNLKTGGIAHLDEENGPRIELLIGGAHYFTLQMEKLKKQGVKMGYIKISIKKNPTDDDFYIENIDAVKEKDS